MASSCDEVRVCNDTVHVAAQHTNRHIVNALRTGLLGCAVH
jgi:hypothetical protein